MFPNRLYLLGLYITLMMKSTPCLVHAQSDSNDPNCGVTYADKHYDAIKGTPIDKLTQEERNRICNHVAQIEDLGGMVDLYSSSIMECQIAGGGTEKVSMCKNENGCKLVYGKGSGGVTYYGVSPANNGGSTCSSPKKISLAVDKY